MRKISHSPYLDKADSMAVDIVELAVAVAVAVAVAEEADCKLAGELDTLAGTASVNAAAGSVDSCGEEAALPVAAAVGWGRES